MRVIKGNHSSGTRDARLGNHLEREERAMPSRASTRAPASRPCSAPPSTGAGRSPRPSRCAPCAAATDPAHPICVRSSYRARFTGLPQAPLTTSSGSHFVPAGSESGTHSARSSCYTRATPSLRRPFERPREAGPPHAHLPSTPGNPPHPCLRRPFGRDTHVPGWPQRTTLGVKEALCDASEVYSPFWP